MFKKLKTAVVLSSLSAIILMMNTSAWGSWDWITETAIGQFTPEDIKILKATGRDALDTQTDDSVVHWSNPKTGNSGSIKITSTKEVDGQKCRTALLKNKTESMEGHVRYLVCQQQDDTWQITVPPKGKK